MTGPVVLKCGCLLYGGTTLRPCDRFSDLWQRFNSASTTKEAEAAYEALIEHKRGARA